MSHQNREFCLYLHREHKFKITQEGT